MSMKFIESVLATVLMAGFFSLPVMWCWNYLMPEIFDLPKLSWFQYWVMLLLSIFLFKSSTSKE